MSNYTIDKCFYHRERCIIVPTTKFIIKVNKLVFKAKILNLNTVQQVLSARS